MRLCRPIAAVLLGITLGFAPPAASVEFDVASGPPAEHAEALDVYDPLFDEEPEDDGSALDDDPFERANRGVFFFNDQLDRWLLDPITRGYQWLVPPPARRGVTRFFANLNSPVVFANHVLQLRPVPAATTIGRFAVNTTFGLAGFFDFADEVMDLHRIEADFGQTLYRYGVPRGPYLMVPLFGPSTARDVVGTVVDQALDPLTYLIGPLNLQWQLILGGGQGIATREANADAMDALREASVDFYAALRSAYLQSRRARELAVRPGSNREASDESAPGEVSTAPEVDPDQDSSVPAASFAIRSSIAAMSASKSSRLTIPENSERRSASSLTVPSR
jgi:phospholipid-binding lipoprotein MlaA